MNDLRRFGSWPVLVMLTGCSSLQSPGGRAVWLVLIPAALIAAVLFVLRRRAAGQRGGRGPRYPDYEERE